MTEIETLTKALEQQVTHNSMVTAALINILKLLDPIKRTDAVRSVESLIGSNSALFDTLKTLNWPADGSDNG